MKPRRSVPGAPLSRELGRIDPKLRDQCLALAPRIGRPAVRSAFEADDTLRELLRIGIENAPAAELTRRVDAALRVIRAIDRKIISGHFRSLAAADDPGLARLGVERVRMAVRRSLVRLVDQFEVARMGRGRR
jgi:hypothetical protein